MAGNNNKIEINKLPIEVTPEQKQCLTALRLWITEEDHLFARTDDDFLFIFLRSCDFHLELTKTTLILYYEQRRKVPQWWANRDVSAPGIQALLKRRITTVLIDKDPNHPSISITILSRFEPTLSNNFDDYLKLSSILQDVHMRRRNCQLNGAIWITDCSRYPWWLTFKFMSPFIARNVINSFYLGMPIKIKKIIMLNAPPAAFAFFKLIQPFLSQSLRERFFFFGSDWSKLNEHMKVELLPEEYGGQNGTLSLHEEAFSKEVQALGEYISDDNKYGFNK